MIAPNGEVTSTLKSEDWAHASESPEERATFLAAQREEKRLAEKISNKKRIK